MTDETAEQPANVELDTGEQNDRIWSASGFTARVQKNEDDEGWAVTMTRDGDAEPVLTSPWTMGRDKKNPKPLNYSDFRTLLKGALDVVTRHEAHARAMRHRSVTVVDPEGASVRVDLDVAADEDDPHALLTAWDASGEKLAERRVMPNYKLASASATRWVAGGYGEV
jgi:hypothetical protein